MALSDEDKKEVGALIAAGFTGDALVSAINGAIRKIAPGIVKSEVEPLSKILTKSGEDMSGLKDSLEALAKAPGKKGEGDEDEASKVLHTRIAELEARDKARIRETKEATRSAAESDKKSVFMTLANKHMRSGDIAYSYLSDRILHSDDSGYQVEVQRDGYKEKIQLEQYLTQDFLTSDEGSTFLPAKGAGGTGGRGGGSGDRREGSGGDSAESQVDDLLDQAGWGQS